MSTVKSKKLQVGTDATSSNNFTIYQPATPDGTLRIGVGNADSPTEVARVTSDGIADANGQQLSNTPIVVAKITSNQTISSSTWTKVTLNSTDIDTDSAFNTTDNKFTVPVGKSGKYNLTGSALIDAIGGAQLARELLAIRKNGAEVKPRYDSDRNNNYIKSATAVITIILDLTEGDEIELYVYGTDASSSPIVAPGGTSLSLHKLIT